MSLSAGIATRTTIADNTDPKKLSVVWEAGDKVSLVFNHPADGAAVAELTSDIEEGTASITKFKGGFYQAVSVDGGYLDQGYAVHPSTAVKADGTVDFTLPTEQTAKEDGSFPTATNLSSTEVSLSKLGDPDYGVNFHNALTVLRFKLSSDVTSLTFEGTAPFTGKAPLVFDMTDEEDDLTAGEGDGRLLIDGNAEWTEGVNRVTLKPADGEAFVDGVIYNLLIWPGEHSALTIKMNFKEYGDYHREVAKTFKFEKSKFYTLNFNSQSELIVTPLYEGQDVAIGNLADIDGRLAAAEEEINKLLSQVQSVSLMSEYIDNAAYAQYGVFNNGTQKLDISLDYLIKPDSAAEALVEAFHNDPTVVSALLGYSNSTGFELTDSQLTVKELLLSEAEGIGKYVTAVVDASWISNDFYNGKCGASLALQIASGNTEMLSDFANLVPRAGSAISGSYLNNIPVIPGTRVVIPFKFAVSDLSADYTVSVSGTENVDWANVSYNTDLRSGNLSVQIHGTKAIESQNVTLSLTIGDGENVEVISHTFTFVDSGSRIDFVDPGKLDYIGGDLVLGVTTEGIKNYMLTSSGAGVSQSGNIFTFTENTGAERTATVECQATIDKVSLNFYKSFTLTQKAVGTSLSRTYYTNGQKIYLNNATANCSDKLNIVILGDGYKKKDLAVGGKFERSARSAMDSFFSIEPYKTFKDRFNVIMVAYESPDEGTDIKSSGVTKNTYFNSYCQGGGNTAAYVDGTDLVVSAVKAAVGNGDQYYYRSIAILLVNTDENSGSTGYPYRDFKSGFVNGYSSFAIAVVAANSTGTNGLVKHEAGGHAFGRLADEYYTDGTTASDADRTKLSSEWHAKGWYWNVNPTNSGNYYKFTNSAYSSEEVSFIEGAWNFQYGFYRPTQGGMMQGSTGVFNAPSRHAIYHRIITETEGANAYSWSKFLEYDKRNR